MPPNVAYPDINGHRVSYSSIEFSIDGLKMKGVRSINYRETTEVGKIRGTSRKPIGRTAGNTDFEGDIEVYRSEWTDLILPKISKGGSVGFSELAWDIAVTYAEPVALSKTVTDRLIGVRFLSPDYANTEGTDALIVKVTLDIMDIVHHNRYVGLRTRL